MATHAVTDRRIPRGLRPRAGRGGRWTAGRTVWPHPGSYSDMVVLPDKTVALVYERDEKGTTHYWDEIDCARFDLEWLTFGRKGEKRP